MKSQIILPTKTRPLMSVMRVATMSKVGILNGNDTFHWLEQNGFDLARNTPGSDRKFHIWRHHDLVLNVYIFKQRVPLDW